VASRKEQKEQLRREREERAAAAREAERRRRVIGYGVAGAVVLAVVVVGAVVLAGGGGGDGSSKGTSLASAAKAAGCELKSFKARSRDHTSNPAKKIKYDSNPPTEGTHFDLAARDSSYLEAPDVKQLVHSLEHGRIVVWTKPDIAPGNRAKLKELYDEDKSKMILTPNETKMPYEVAASAWSREPQPLGTGRLLGCPRYDAKVVDAVRAFRDEHRGKGPEDIP
jgi:Protein of unknown function (DUF3105)